MKTNKYLTVFVIMGFLACSLKAQVSGTWTQTNLISFPVNTAGQPTGIGRVSHFAFHPTDTNTLYAVSASGGVWKTTNNAATWVNLNTDFFPRTSLACILVNPLNPTVLYVGSGDADYYSNGYGVWKSNNAGLTWFQSNSGMGNILARRMVMYAGDTSVLIAACKGGIYKSTNGGSTWVKKTSGTLNFRDVKYKMSAGTKTLFACTFTNFYTSTDNGETWSDITASAGIVPADAPTAVISAMEFALAASDSQIVYILTCDNGATNRTFNGLFRSVNGGQTFTLRSKADNPPSASGPNILGYDNSTGASLGSQGGYNLCLVVHPSNANMIYTGSQNCWRSSDGGATWSLRSCWGCSASNGLHADHHWMQFHPMDSYPRRLYHASDGGMSRTTENTDSIWEVCSDGLSATEYYKMGQSPIYKELMLGGCQDNGLQYYYDQENRTIQGGDVTADFDFDFYDYHKAYRQGDYYTYTADKTQSAKYKTTTISNSTIVGSAPIYVQHGIDSNCVYACNTDIYVSKNIRSASITWTKISASIPNASSASYIKAVVSRINPNHLYAIRNDTKLIRCLNILSPNPNFEVLSLPSGVSTAYCSIDVHPTNEAIIYASFGSKVYRSINYGSSWTDMSSGLPGVNVIKIISDKRSSVEAVYACQASGIYYHDNSALNWFYYSGTLPSIANITDMELYYGTSNESLIRVSTYGKGIWQSELYKIASTAPTAAFGIYTLQQTIGGQQSPSNTCTSTILCANVSTGNPSSFTWSISPASGWSFVNGTNATSKNIQINWNNSGKYTISLTAINATGNTVYSKDYIYSKLSVAPVCTPTSTNKASSYGMGISYVQFGDIDKTTGSSTYEDVSCGSSGVCMTGRNYAFKVNTLSSYTQYLKIYIDYNNNGSFSDAGETVYSATSKATTFSGNISILSSGVTMNTYLRIRVVSDYNSISSNPCTILGYGTIRDFAIMLIAPTVPDCAVILNPTNGSISSAGTMTLQWNNSVHADSFYVYHGNTINPAFVNVTKNNFYTINTNPNTTYYWKIIPKNANGTASACSVNQYSTTPLPTMQMRVLLEGMYASGGKQIPMLSLQGLHTASNIADSISIELHATNSPDYTTLFSTKVLINDSGKTTCTLPANLFGAVAYIVCKHRNSIETWSQLPVYITATISYDFSSGISKAYNNAMKNSGDGYSLIYTGDINQDGIVNNDDMVVWDNDNVGFASGYISTDLNGDGIVSNDDMTFLDNNNSNFIGISKPE